MGQTHEKCNTCGSYKRAEFVDVGVGYVQVTEGICPNECEYIEWLEKQECDSLTKEDKQ